MAEPPIDNLGSKARSQSGGIPDLKWLTVICRYAMSGRRWDCGSGRAP